jgi:hypothetical protein
MSQPTIDSPTSFHKSFARIAQFRPFGDGEIEVAFARRQFVLAAAVENGGSLESVDEGQEACRTLWNLELDRDEVETELRQLVRVGKLERKPSRGYRLAPGTAIEYAEKSRGSELTQEQAIAEWAVAVRAMDPDLSEAELKDLKADLVNWVQKIIASHGMEAALVLYPEQAQERAEEFFTRIEASGCDFLANRGEKVNAVREKALYLFLRNPTNNQRSYLANLMTTAYLMAVFTIDPEAHEVVKQLTKGQVIYLDTNVVYDVLNLSGPRKYMSIKRVLELTRKLGYEIRVTPWTVSEMKHSVRKARDEISKVALPPKALADLAAEAAGDDGFLTAYWRKYKETGVRPDDFFDLHEQIEGLLEEADIQIDNEGCTAVDQDANGLARQVGLLATIPGGSTKPHPVMDHDAKHRLLIERLRGSGDRRFSNAGYWFLTDDSVLIPFAREQRSDPREIPFAVSLSAWTHIVRSLSPRTEDYEQTLVDLLDSAAVRPKGVVSSSTVSEVLGRIDMVVKDSTEEIATRMLLDRAVMTEAERRTGASRDRFIEGAIEQKGSELERELKEIRDAAERERQAREASEKRVVAQAERLKRERGRRYKTERRLDELEKKRRDDVEEASARVHEQQERAEKAEQELGTSEVRRAQEVGDLQSRLSLQEKAVKRHESIIRIFGACLLGILAAALTLVPLVGGWVTGGWGLAALIMGSLGVGFIALALLWGNKKAGAMASLFLLILSLATGIHSITSTGTESSNPAKSGNK